MIKQAAHNPKKDDVDFGDDINNGSRGAAAGVNALAKLCTSEEGGATPLLHQPEHHHHHHHQQQQQQHHHHQLQQLHPTNFTTVSDVVTAAAAPRHNGTTLGAHTPPIQGTH